ncbi:uncharacterized protein PHALS_07724 [Plasmopara halstedii]|uniref:Uncharacterized protein n=1 Tax=Plasmopara halstedii TaxID=4781 RepID=A0A0P1B629_PLAHL|nr:uncharacterized protein PHALS_07724 [Plasmopara halstedii]CEG49991.1 hypothetical protein PHALS_07724 [Plasmopara halstedii]|eukprot:XP_024586360.1 hypothetical protein PHALS_07724 [Plasmopara halstedii]
MCRGLLVPDQLRFRIRQVEGFGRSFISTVTSFHDKRLAVDQMSLSCGALKIRGFVGACLTSYLPLRTKEEFAKG